MRMTNGVPDGWAECAHAAPVLASEVLRLHKLEAKLKLVTDALEIQKPLLRSLCNRLDGEDGVNASVLYADNLKALAAIRKEAE